MKTKTGHREKCKSGSMLALAIMIVVVLAIVGAALIRMGGDARIQSIRDVQQISARSAADAGIEHAVRYMIDSWNSSTNKSDWVNNIWYDATDWTDNGWLNRKVWKVKLSFTTVLLAWKNLLSS